MIVVLVKENLSKPDATKKLFDILLDLVEKEVLTDFAIYATPIEDFEVKD